MPPKLLLVPPSTLPKTPPASRSKLPKTLLPNRLTLLKTLPASRLTPLKTLQKMSLPKQLTLQRLPHRRSNFSLLYRKKADAMSAFLFLACVRWLWRNNVQLDFPPIESALLPGDADPSRLAAECTRQRGACQCRQIVSLG